jgi:flagellar biosynthesis protein
MEKQKIAAAIGYSPEDPSPRLLASGKNLAAERIIAIAEESGVAVAREPGLAAMVESGARPGDLIPVWCWEAAAAVLAFVLKEH